MTVGLFGQIVINTWSRDADPYEWATDSDIALSTQVGMDMYCGDQLIVRPLLAQPLCALTDYCLTGCS